MTRRNYDVQKQLKKWFADAGNVVVAGIGNPIRMDDFVGIKILQSLQGKVSEKTYLIECETVPENYIQQIIDFEPSHILLIDAALLNLPPGESRLVKPEKLTAHSAFSTHMLPLRIFCEYLAKTTNVKIALLLIQPEQTDFGEGVTPKIEATVRYLVDILAKLLT